MRKKILAVTAITAAAAMALAGCSGTSDAPAEGGCRSTCRTSR